MDPPGNGKTTLAKCLTACRSQEIWIPSCHNRRWHDYQTFRRFLPSSSKQGLGKSLFAAQEFDRRWVRIRRPTVVVGGELTLDNLEIRHDPRSNTCEAPLQMKSNCGCLLIDDFGRQRVAPAELLNRWIVLWRVATTSLPCPRARRSLFLSNRSFSSRPICNPKNWSTKHSCVAFLQD